MSAAMGPGGLDYETLHRKLSLVRSYVDLFLGLDAC